VFKALYARVASGKEAERVISACGGADYQSRLAKELGAVRDSEMWRAGAAVRALRPAEKARVVSKSTKGVSGRKY
jgi:ketol-acid reductoisomerase